MNYQELDFQNTRFAIETLRLKILRENFKAVKNKSIPSICSLFRINPNYLLKTKAKY